MDLSNFLKNLRPSEFKPSVFLNEDGLQLEVYTSNESYYGTQIGNIALHINEETKECIGLTVYISQDQLEKMKEYFT